MRISPASGGMKPAIRRSSVVLPQPLGPSSVVMRPSGADNDTSETASTPPKRLLRWTSSTYRSSTDHSWDRMRASRESPGRGDDDERDGEKGCRQRRRRLEAVVADQAKDGEGRDLRARGDEKHGDAEVCDAADERGRPACNASRKHQPEMDIPQDPQPRGAKIRGGIGQAAVDLGETRPNGLVAERQVSEGEGQD